MLFPRAYFRKDQSRPERGREAKVTSVGFSSFSSFGAFFCVRSYPGRAHLRSVSLSEIITKAWEVPMRIRMADA
jgi:hypothetical protein